ncbi:hypothetical protein C0991_007051 [Blastosporella zonata]|nr:hypothetical protein C0991_007051 [Blastosporella zonata]
MVATSDLNQTGTKLTVNYDWKVHGIAYLSNARGLGAAQFHILDDALIPRFIVHPNVPFFLYSKTVHQLLELHHAAFSTGSWPEDDSRSLAKAFWGTQTLEAVALGAALRLHIHVPSPPASSESPRHPPLPPRSPPLGPSPPQARLHPRDVP